MEKAKRKNDRYLKEEESERRHRRDAGAVDMIAVDRTKRRNSVDALHAYTLKQKGLPEVSKSRLCKTNQSLSCLISCDASSRLC